MVPKPYIRHNFGTSKKCLPRKNTLRANVTNAAVRCLSNLPLEAMLENRHSMSRVVRAEVSPKSEEWGYQLGSVYIRKVHFRDDQMIGQIEHKVVNRLRQVTSAIRQAGANQVDVITSAAERQAAAEIGRVDPFDHDSFERRFTRLARTAMSLMRSSRLSRSTEL